MVKVGTGSSKTRFIKRDWPVDKGLTAGTEKQEGRKPFLKPQIKSLVRESSKKGL